MNPKQQRRLIGIISLVVLVSASIGLILYALKQNINLFYTPTELSQHIINPDQVLRIGGYVKKNSIHYDASGETVNFIITDQTHEISTTYHGVLPSLFREGQGVVVTGKLSHPHAFIADQVLAKHDEKYMPWPLSKELKAYPGDKNAS